jgi:N-acetylmuramoyl-L-alanine amidase
VNEVKFTYCGITSWHEAGYTGRGIKVAVFEDTSQGHGRMVGDILQQILPNATILNRPRPGPIESVGDRLKPDTRERLPEFYSSLVSEGVHICAMSLGGTGTSESAQLEQELLIDRGIVLFTSAGNEGREIPPRTAAAMATWIAVGACALTKDGPRRTSYSNYGPQLGVMGFTNLTTSWGGVFPGTSAANPFVAGMCALWFQWFREQYGRTPNQAETLEFIRQNSEDLGEPGRDDKHGFGLLRLPDPSTLRKEGPKVYKVCLDPGHGGTDPGAVGPGGTKEKDINLIVAKQVADHLGRHGVQVVMTRDGDQTVSLDQRCTISDNAGADLFVSIHCNAVEDRTAHGTETWYVSPTGQKLAQKVQTGLIVALGRADRGVKQGNKYVLKNTKAPAALVELAFISNPEEEKLLASADFPKRAAEAVARGVLAHLGVAWKEPVAPKPDPAPSPAPTKVVLKLTVGGREIRRSDGKVFPMDVPARVETGRTLVPLRAICEALGAQVDYNAATKDITITA